MAKNIELLLEYQNLDAQLDKLENELKNCEERKKALYYKNMFYKSQEEIQKIEAAADALTLEMEKLEKKTVGMKDDLIIEIENEDDLDLARKCASQIASELKKLDGELQDLSRRAKGLETKMAEYSQNLSNSKKEYGEYRAKFEKKSAELNPQIEQARKARDEFGKKVSAPLLERYNTIKKNKIMPIAYFENGKCLGCNMELPYSITSKVKETDQLIECENCGRILLYKS